MADGHGGIKIVIEVNVSRNSNGDERRNDKENVEIEMDEKFVLKYGLRDIGSLRLMSLS